MKITTINKTGTNELNEIHPTVRNNKSYDEIKSLRPSIESPSEILKVYDAVNSGCFNGKLPEVVISYLQKKNVPSHFQVNRFQRARGELFHGLAFNALLMGMRSQRESMTTIGYEAIRVARHEFGPVNKVGGKGTKGYHDAPMAMLAERIGLKFSDTGLPCGKNTGAKMSYYLIEGGQLAKVIDELLQTGFRINWHDRIVFQNSSPSGIQDEAIPAPKKDRVKFSCTNEQCGLNAWAKPSARLTCGFCNQPMLSPDAVSASLIKI